MICKLCDGSGVLFSTDDIFVQSECPDCKGTGKIDRYIIEDMVSRTSLEKHLKVDPHSDFRLVSVTPHVVDGYMTYTLFWERNEQ